MAGGSRGCQTRIPAIVLHHLYLLQSSLSITSAMAYSFFETTLPFLSVRVRKSELLDKPPWLLKLRAVDFFIVHSGQDLVISYGTPESYAAGSAQPANVAIAVAIAVILICFMSLVIFFRQVLLL